MSSAFDLRSSVQLITGKSSGKTSNALCTDMISAKSSEVTTKPLPSKRSKRCHRKVETDSKKDLKSVAKGYKNGVKTDDCDCYVCGCLFSQSRPKEKWIQCGKCLKWAHEECVDILDHCDFFCDFCKT